VKKIVMCRRRQWGTPLADLAFAGLDRNQEEELMTYFRHAAIVAAVVAGATTASAQTTIITREPVESRTVVTTEPLELTPVQRRTIYRTIVRERVAPAEPTVEYRVGARLPDSVRLYSVPQEVAVEVPTIRSYKYMVVNNRVVLVDPATSQVVEEVVD
jgi:Protein of unknown function (DUF1236)